MPNLHELTLKHRCSSTTVVFDFDSSPRNGNDLVNEVADFQAAGMIKFLVKKPSVCRRCAGALTDMVTAARTVVTHYPGDA